jgi:hypothetical protein
MRFQKIIAAFVATVGVSSSALGFDSPPFPRLGTFLTGSPANYDNSALQAQIAHASIAIFSYWPGWNCCHTETFEQSMEAIKKLNPNIQLAVYSEIDGNVNSAPYQPALAIVNTMNWWLYPSGTSGTPVSSPYSGGGGPFYQINITAFPAKNSNGQRYVDWYAAWYVANFVKPNPTLNSLYTDYVFWKPVVDGDWNLDGVTDSQNDPTAQGVVPPGISYVFQRSEGSNAGSAAVWEYHHLGWSRRADLRLYGPAERRVY